jgi:hypothetical protein
MNTFPGVRPLVRTSPGLFSCPPSGRKRRVHTGGEAAEVNDSGWRRPSGADSGYECYPRSASAGADYSWAIFLPSLREEKARSHWRKSGGGQRFGVGAAPPGLTLVMNAIPGVRPLVRTSPGLFSCPPSGRKRRVRSGEKPRRSGGKPRSLWRKSGARSGGKRGVWPRCSCKTNQLH